MINASPFPDSLDGADLLSATRELVRKSHGVEAELLMHLGEIDERKLYLDCAYPSMFAFCIGELGFSEDAAYNRITVARAGRRLPAVLEAARSGRVHLAGLRLLAPHLNSENHEEVLAQAAGKSKREVEELVARLAPLPPVPAAIRKLPESPVVTSAPMPWRAPSWAAVTPLSGETFKVQFTASRALRDKLQEAQGLLRHRVPGGDLATIVEKALDLLIEEVKKERFAVGRKARAGSGETAEPSTSRHIPDPIKRAVYERDGGRCTFVDEHGRRCAGTAALEFDHVEGFARTGVHGVDGIRLLCRAHNQHAAEQLYGRAFMEQARGARDPPSTRPGTS